MTHKEVMKQALDALNNCTYDEEGYCLIPDNEDAITALRQAIAAEPNIGRTLDQFLCNGTRIKLNFNKAGNMTSLQNMAHDLQGRWVALVPAENDCHLKQTEYAPLSDARIEQIAIAVDMLCDHLPDDYCDSVGLERGTRMYGDVDYPQIITFARAIEQEVRGK